MLASNPAKNSVADSSGNRQRFRSQDVQSIHAQRVALARRHPRDRLGRHVAIRAWIWRRRLFVVERNG
jgi:hypothetical protein